MKYSLAKTKNISNIIELNSKKLDGYKFKPKKIKDSYIKVSEVTIVDRVMIDKILTMKFDKSFKRLVTLAMNVINDEDATDDDVQIVLGEAELLREILENRYQKFLGYEKEQLLLKKLRVIDNEMRLKQVAIKQKAIYLEMMESRSIGRGR